jgi:hypothetical protein
MEFVTRCITILNEMALDPEIYPYQEIPAVILLFPEESRDEKHNALVMGLGLDATKIESKVGHSKIFHFDNGIVNGIVNPANEELGCGFETQIALGFTISNMDLDSIPDPDAETKVRSAFRSYFEIVCLACDDLRKDDCIPRFTVGDLLLKDYISPDGTYMRISFHIAYESLVQ